MVTHPADLPAQPGPPARIGGTETSSLAVDRSGPLVSSSQLEAVSQALGDAGPGVDVEVIETSGCLERARVEPGGLDRRAVALRPVTGHARVAPRLAEAAGAVKVDGEEFGEGVGVVARLLEDQRRSVVQRPSRPKGEAFVGDITEKDVAESHVARGLGDEEVRQSPDVVCHLGSRLFDHRSQHLDLEVATEHGGVTEQRSIRARQRVDARCDDGLDGVG